MSLELKTVKTHKAPVRYIEGGSGQPLVFLHGAGGAQVSDPFLTKLAAKYHVYAPLLPGYGDSVAITRTAPWLWKPYCQAPAGR